MTFSEGITAVVGWLKNQFPGAEVIPQAEGGKCRLIQVLQKANMPMSNVIWVRANGQYVAFALSNLLLQMKEAQDWLADHQTKYGDEPYREIQGQIFTVFVKTPKA